MQTVWERTPDLLGALENFALPPVPCHHVGLNLKTPKVPFREAHNAVLKREETRDSILSPMLNSPPPGHDLEQVAEILVPQFPQENKNHTTGPGC